jgi:hypothetical protein
MPVGASNEGFCGHVVPLEEIRIRPTKTGLRPLPDIPACPKSERRNAAPDEQFGLSQPLAPRPVVNSARSWGTAMGRLLKMERT